MKSKGKSRSKAIITIHDVEEIKEMIKFMIDFDHPDNPYFDSTESKVSKLLMNRRKTCAEEYSKIKRLENDLFY